MGMGALTSFSGKLACKMVASGLVGFSVSWEFINLDNNLSLIAVADMFKEMLWEYIILFICTTGYSFSSCPLRQK